ncbi:glutathione S-transferase family protein [Geitlerinema sp. PCC 7407]|uniref:glutathione S-transferase family protein n=1 Tax=Geitlerinema sp. PCC 7407 TaxID=1173025 RepID=UPI00029FE9EB|nr:glutathione S-transferase family protein [Geitlerinema sp. PCC 7407]AFY65126.1 Glutathione S-transferase domain protein [Geitlerinema sp. PCC 7407]
MNRILYYAQRSPYARKVRIILAEKQLPCELRETDIKNKSDELLRLSPIGKVPILVEDDLVLWDSTQIVEYLDETYPEPAFYPSDRAERLRCRQGEELADTLMDTVVGLWFQKQKSTPDAADQAKLQQLLDRLLHFLNQRLSGNPYLFGENWSAIDVSALCALGYYSLRFGTGWQAQYPHLKTWFEALHQRESVRSTMPQG